MERFSFPAGATPGFDPSHPAATGIGANGGCSIIASADGGARNLLKPQQGTLVGTVSGAMDGRIGPSCSFATNGNNARSFSGYSTIKPDNNTVACICVPQTSTADFNGFIATGTLWGVQLGCSTDGTWSLYPAGQALLKASTIPTVSLGTPYFVAISSGVSLATNFAVVNLSTGQTYFQSTSAPSTFGGNPSGTYRLGGGLNTTASQPGLVSHAMFSPSYMTVAGLAQWAANPWDFWYPK